MSKEVILPILTIVVVIIIIWAWMTKCGKRACCKRSSGLRAVETRKSVKSDRSETNNDIESGSAGSGGMNTDMSLAGNYKLQTTNKHGVSGSKAKLDMEMTAAVNPFDRASEPNKPSASLVVQEQVPQGRNSNQLFGQATTANRNSLPTVSVPIQHIRS